MQHAADVSTLCKLLHIAHAMLYNAELSLRQLSRRVCQVHVLLLRWSCLFKDAQPCC